MHPVIVLVRRLFFPAVCLSCGEDLPSRSRAPLCGLCLDTFAPCPSPPVPALLDGLTAVTLFSGAARDAVHRAKYGRKSYVAGFLGRCVSAAMDIPVGEMELIVPVPSPWRRRLDRGYNPAEVMAVAVGRRWGIPVRTGALRRRSGHRTQTALGRRDRMENARQSFAAGFGIGAVRGRRVLLVDDVCTSGATLTSCAALLRKAGAVAVSAAVFAWEPPPASTMPSAKALEGAVRVERH